MIAPRIDARDYYDFLPPNVHRTGDIWRGLPTFGMLGRRFTPAIVITPACDLENRKSETITYIPIIPVNSFLSSPPFYFDLWAEISTTLMQLKMEAQVTPPGRFALPNYGEINSVIAAISHASKKSDIPALEKLRSYASFLDSALRAQNCPVHDIAKIFRKTHFARILNNIVTNSFRVDIHFLPEDRKPEDSSAVPNHSVTLFRYPLSVPTYILDVAQNASPSTWPNEMGRLCELFPVATSFEEWPIRLATLKDDFLSDLISRYLAMHIRLGSRDFTHDTVARYAKEIGE
jgi:hypothetical protein